MSDPRNIIKHKFSESHRYSNFGSVITYMRVKGFRCHVDTIINIESPITALCGLNGTGKTTLLHLVACAYNPCDERLKGEHYISRYIRVGKLDKDPFTENANFEYQVYNNNNKLETLRIYRRLDRDRWRYDKTSKGNYNQLKKDVFFAKISSYFPKIEKPDTTIKQAKKLSINESNPVNSNISKWLEKIIGKSYDNTLINDISYQKYIGQVFSLSISQKNYSESNMGHGEGRMLFILSEIEKLPDKSLVLIEEPEISLHASAQYKFGQYLMDVAINKGHQIIITTHSEDILKCLPMESRIYLYRQNNEIKVIQGLTSCEAINLMADGNKKALSIFVEDKLSKTILEAIIQRLDSQFLRSITIYNDYVHKGKKPDEYVDTSGKGKEEIARLIRDLNKTDIKAVAVLDGDGSAVPGDNIFKLPGNIPPEKAILYDDYVKAYILKEFSVDQDFWGKIEQINHHKWFEELANSINRSEDSLTYLIVDCYVKNLPENEISPLLTQLKESLL
jgi:predicted ATPase/thioredoxin-related protein